MVSFAVSRQEALVIRKIAERAVSVVNKTPLGPYDLQSAQMDITAVHANGNPLRLQELLTADDFNFGHDIFGILRHINRDTGKLENFFIPRFTLRKVA